MPTFSALFEEKAASVQAAAEAKKSRMGNTSVSDYFKERMAQEQRQLAPMFSLQDSETFKVHLDPIKEGPIEATIRGGSEAVQGMINLGYGLGAGVGAVAESVLGEGGMSTQFKEAMVKKYVENEEEMAFRAKPEDSLTYSWEKAKEGDYGAMLSWATHGTGYVASQLATMLVGSGVIAGGTRLFGKKAVGQLMGSLVEKEAGRIAALTTDKVITDSILKEATKTITNKVGAHLGMAATGFGMETGEIMGDLAKQSVERGKPLTGAEIGKGLSASALAGAVEYTETLLGLKALGGKLGKIPGMGITESISGIAGKAARGAVTGLKTAAGEAVQEATQTGIERWGKGQEVFSEEGQQEIIDAAGLGALGGGPASIGGFATRSIKEQEDAQKQREEKQRINPELSPGFKENVTKAAETPDGVKTFSDPKSPDYNETTAINIMAKRVRREDVSKEEKIKTGNDAIKLFQNMYKERAELFTAYKNATEEELQKNPEKFAAMETKIQELNTRIDDTTPLIQAIAKPQEGIDSEKLLNNFRNAFVKKDGTTTGSPAESIRNIFGSSSTQAFFDKESDDYVDLNESLNTHGSSLSAAETAEIKAGARLQQSVGTAIKYASKKTGEVTTDILEGSADGDFKGIPQHLDEIATALSSGDINQAQQAQERLIAWAKARERRASTFDEMYKAFEDPSFIVSDKAKQHFNQINNYRLAQGFKEPYYVNAKTAGLVKSMQLESAALKDAAVYGQQMIETNLNKDKQTKQLDKIETPVVEPVKENIQNTPQETPIPAADTPSLKATNLSLTEATTAFNQESEKPFKERDISRMKALRERIQALRKEKNVEPALQPDIPEYSEEPVKRYKEKPSVVVKIPRRYRGKPVQEVVEIPTKGNRTTPIIMRNTPEHILFVPTLLEDKWQAKSWTKPAILSDGSSSTPLAEDSFKSKEDLLLFMLAHENVHDRVKIEKDETRGAYEDRVNQAAIKEVQEMNKPLNERITTSDIKSEQVDKKDLFKINPLRVFGKAINKKHPTLFNQNLDIIEHIQKYRNQRIQGDSFKDQREGLDVLSDFLDKFTQEFNSVFKPKRVYEKGDFRWEDSLSYFIPEGQNLPPEEIIQAMGLSAFEWLNTQATNFNDDDVLRKILGLGSSDVLSFEVKPLRKIGNKAVYIAKNIGREVLNNLQIGFDDNAPATFEEHIMVSIGNNILGALQSMGVIERHYINSGTSSKISSDQATTGLQGLANKLRGSRKDIGIISEKDLIMDGPSTTAGQTADDFYSLVSSDETAKYSKTYKDIKDDLKVIFGLEKDTDEFTFEEPKPSDKPRSLTKSDELATKEQSANLTNNERTAYVLSQNTYKALKAFSLDTQKKFAGYETMEGKHISREDSIKGANREIDDQFDSVNYWKDKAIREDLRLKTPFYIKAVFQANSRMRQVGTIMPQNKKIHRALFSMQTSFVEVNPKETEHKESFMAALGLTFGIEASKESSLEEVIRKTQEVMDSEIVQNALAILDKIQDKKTLTPEDEQVMLKAVKKGKEDLLSFKGLVEYHKYLQAQKDEKSFTTDLFMEIDGLANGPFMMSLQLRLNKIDKEFLQRMMSTGLAFGVDENRSLQDHQVSKDPYQSIGAAWDEEVQKALNVAEPLVAEKIQAISNLLGGFDKPSGSLFEHSRKLSKTSTVGAVYGAERASTVRGFVSHIIDEVIPATFEKLESLKKTDPVNYKILRQQLHDAVVTLSGIKNPWASGTKETLNVQLTSAAKAGIASNIDEYYGDTLFNAMNAVYGDFREASKVLNKGIGILAARYNAALKYLISQIKGPITKADVKRIRETLAPLLPRVKTPMGGSIVLFDFEGDDLVKAPVNKNEPNFVRTEQSFNQKGTNKRVSLLRGKAETLKQLKASGVKPIPTIIHMLDSMVANKLMGAADPKTMGILNVHDAGITSLFDFKKMADIQNAAMMDIMESYHVAEEVQKTVTETLPRLFEIFKDSKEQAAVREFLKTEYAEQRYDQRKEEYVDREGNIRTKNVKMELKEVSQHTLKEINNIAAITKTNKHSVLDHTTYMNQYFDPSGGFRTSKEQADKIAGIPLKDIIKKNDSEVENTASDVINPENINDATDAQFGSSGKQKMSIDPLDYATENGVNSGDVMDVYFDIRNKGKKRDSENHDIHLRIIISEIIQKFIQPFHTYYREDAYQETAGVFDADTQRIFIQSHSGLLNQGISMSTGEVYVHELIHAITHEALDKHKDLRNKVSRLYDVVFKELHKKYPGEEYKVFLDNPAMDLTDPHNQENIQIAKDRYDYFFRTPDKRGRVIKNAYTGVAGDRTLSNHLDEFLAFAVTNENFSNFLKTVVLENTTYAKSSWGTLRGNNIQETLINIFQAILNFFKGKFTDVNKKTAYQETEALIKKLAYIQSRYKTQRFERARKFVGSAGQAAALGNGIIHGAFHKLVPNAKNWKKGFDILVADPSKGGPLFHEAFNYFQAMDQRIIKTTLQEAWGKTERLSDYYQLLTRRKRVLDAAKETADQAYSDAANAFFNFRLKKNQKVAFTKAGLKTDIVVLLDSLGSTRLLEVFKNEDARAEEIQKIRDALSDKNKFPATAAYAHYYDRAAMALGDFLVHSQFRVGEDAGLNSQLISELSGTSKAGQVKQSEAKKVEGLIDQLASLHAIGSLPLVHKNDFIGIMEEDLNGVSKTLQLHKVLKEAAKEHLFAGSSRLAIKGYTKTSLNPEISLKYGFVEDEDEMRRCGYTRSPHPLPKDPNDPYRKPVYTYIARTGRLNNLASGILSYTRNKSKGTSTQEVSDAMNPYTKKGFQNFTKVTQAKMAIRDAMFTKTRNPKAKLTHGLIAKVDRHGTTTDYRYMMSEATKDAFLDQVSDFDSVLGSMAAQIMDKQATPIINEELIKRLKITYDEEYSNNPKAFVSIGPGVKDPDMVELYYMIPEKTRNDITLIWGPTKTMYVPKDLMTLAFGYRKYSMVDAFIKTESDRSQIEKIVVAIANGIMNDPSGNRGRGVKLVNTAEQLAMEMAHYAKDNIIVKSLTLTLSNFGSNLVYLRMRGIPMSVIFKYGWEAVKYGIKYQSDLMNANRLGIEKGLLEKENTPSAKRRLRIVENELLQYTDALNRNPVADSIDSGLMPSLIDDVNTQGQKNYFPGKIESFIEKKTEGLPKPLKTTGKVIFLSQDTEAYKVLNNGVKLTDFVGRHVLYNHYVKTQGMDPKEAAQRAIEEFVNFDIPSHRITEYLNEIGILWFTKYATRIPMIAAKAIMDKPFTSWMSYLLSSHIGLDNIIDSAIPNIGYKIDAPPTALISSMDELMTAQLLGAILP